MRRLSSSCIVIKRLDRRRNAAVLSSTILSSSTALSSRIACSTSLLSWMSEQVSIPSDDLVGLVANGYGFGNETSDTAPSRPPQAILALIIFTRFDAERPLAPYWAPCRRDAQNRANLIHSRSLLGSPCIRRIGRSRNLGIHPPAG